MSLDHATDHGYIMEFSTLTCHSATQTPRACCSISTCGRSCLSKAQAKLSGRVVFSPGRALVAPSFGVLPSLRVRRPFQAALFSVFYEEHGDGHYGRARGFSARQFSEYRYAALWHCWHGDTFLAYLWRCSLFSPSSPLLFSILAESWHGSWELLVFFLRGLF